MLAHFEQIPMFLGFSPSFFFCFTDRWLSALVAAWGWLSGAYVSLSHLTNGLCLAFLVETRAAVAQLAARRSHNPKVVTSILTCRKLYAIAAAPIGVLVGAKVSRTCLRASNCGFAAGV